MPWRALSRRRNSAATVGSCWIRPRRSISPIRLRTGLLTTLPKMDSRHLGRAISSGAAGFASIRPTSSSAAISPAASSSARHVCDRVVTHGHLEGGLGVAASSGVAGGHQSLAISSSRRPCRRCSGIPRRDAAGARRSWSPRRPCRPPAARGRRPRPGRPRSRGSSPPRSPRRPGRAGARAPRGSRRYPRHACPGRPSGHGPGSRSPRGAPRRAWRHARPPRCPDRDGPARRP